MTQNFSSTTAGHRALNHALQKARLLDKVRIQREWSRAFSHQAQPEPELSEADQTKMRRLLERAGLAAEHSLIPHAELLKIDYPEELPITAHRQEILDALQNNQLIIVAGATGSGKTTQLPKMALEAGCGRYGRIGCTQPRRLAASSLARRTATEMRTEFGTRIGYKVRFDDHTSDQTVVKFMTDGILLAETREDRDLLQYDCLILDEVHERSLNIDFLLGYLKQLLMRRHDLKVIISSATLELERFSEFFGNVPLIEVEGRTYPIEDYYLAPYPDEELSEHVARGVTFLTELDPQGDILVFLPGEREIRDAINLLTGRHLPRTELLPLFGRLSTGEQNRIFSPGGARRIILATNVAETSLTIPGIRYVIDSGQVRLSRYNPRTRIQELRIEQIAKASIRQRRGRCGRLSDGICVHLYSEETAQNAPDYTDPEIKRSALAGVILQMASLRLGRIEEFPLVDPPSPQLIREGYRTLLDLGALTEAGRITECGKTLAKLPVDPHLGKMLEAAHQRKVLPQMVILAAYLSIPDPRERPFEKVQAADQAHKRWASEKSDFCAALNLYAEISQIYEAQNSHSAVRRFAVKNFLNYRRLREWKNLVDDLTEIAFDNEWTGVVDAARDQLLKFDYDALHMALLAGLPRQLGCFDKEQKNYFDMAGKRYKIFPGSGLAKRKSPAPWLLSFALVETSQVFARICAEAKPEWLQAIAPWLCTPVYDQAHYSPPSGFVYARERLTAGRLLIHPGRQRHYAPVNPLEARAIFIRDALTSGNIEEHQTNGVPWLGKYLEKMRDLRKFELKTRRPEMLFNTKALHEFFTERLPLEGSSLTALKELWKKDHVSYLPPDPILLQEDARQWLQPEEFPDFLTFSGVRFPLEYKFAPGEENDGITLLAEEEKVNLLPSWALDMLVRGFLPEKIEFYLRSLPKSDRQKIQPISTYISSVMERLRSGKLFGERELKELLSDDLSRTFQLAIKPDAFQEVRLPEYLQMKLLILDDEGNAKELLRKIPVSNRTGSKLSSALPSIRNFRAEAGKEWPRVPELPLEISLTKNAEEKAYPALTAMEEDGVGVEVFLKAAEAHYRHDDGLCALLRLQLAGLLNAIRKDFRIPQTLEKNWFKRPGAAVQPWKDELLNAVIRQALGDPEFRWKLRSKAAYDHAREMARIRFSRTADELVLTLTKLHQSYESLQSLCKKVPSQSAGKADVERQLAFLFRPGFLRNNVWQARYSRYLRGMELRVQRMISDCRRDSMKGEGIEPFLERFYLAANNCENMELLPELKAYWLLTEEARLAVYAPEVRLLEKATPKILEERWETLRY